MRRIGVGLVHYPVLDREKRIVTTAITNLDLHDIARSAYTYAVSSFFVIHPVRAQRDLALRVREHWTSGSGARRIPDRTFPMQILNVVSTIDDAAAELGSGEPVEIWTTSASADAPALGYTPARERLQQAGAPVLLLFGTGWGLADEVHERAGVRLEPIRSARADGYNHLSVRAAAAISFDRLFARSHELQPSLVARS
jgi:hypothetical protein